jgi:hypothetical protein
MRRLWSLVLLALAASTARAGVITYYGCFSDAHVSACITVPYTITPVTQTLFLVQGGPITYNSETLAPNTFFIPIYQVFPFSFMGNPDDGHIGMGLPGFESFTTGFSALPGAIALRFVEIVNCPFTPSDLNPCGVQTDPAEGLLSNQYVTDVRVPLNAVPEPTSAVLVGTALVVLLTAGAFSNRRRQRLRSSLARLA